MPEIKANSAWSLSSLAGVGFGPHIDTVVLYLQSLDEFERELFAFVGNYLQIPDLIFFEILRIKTIRLRYVVWMLTSVALNDA